MRLPYTVLAGDWRAGRAGKKRENLVIAVARAAVSVANVRGRDNLAG